MIIHYQRYIGVTDEEEAVLRDALVALRASQLGNEGPSLETIVEGLLARLFPTGETQAEAYYRLEREAAGNPLPPDEKADRVYRRLLADMKKAKERGGLA